MSQVPTFVVAPGVEARLREQLLVEPLPARTLEQRLVWDAKGCAGESMPKYRVLVVGVEIFLSIGVNKMQQQR